MLVLSASDGREHRGDRFWRKRSHVPTAELILEH
jgi:hypothetical protein